MASDVERLNGYDDACILEDLPASMGRNGPYRVTMAAAAALSLIEAEGVSLFHYDSVNGLENELDFDVELLLPSGRKYTLARPDRPSRAPKEHDTSCRIRFQMGIPSALSARSGEEREMAMTRLRDHLRNHFLGHGAHNVGFHKHRDERSGRSAQGLVGFVNHPVTVSRAEFITTTFQDLKYVDAGMGELVKLTLDHDDTVKACIMKCCFRAVCPKQRGGKCDVWIQTMRLRGLMPNQPSDSARGKRKMEVTDQQEAYRASQMSATKARRIDPQCRAHVRGRCVNGSACKHPRHHGPCEHHLQQHGHGSGQGSVSLQQVLRILRAPPEGHGMPLQRLRPQAGHRRAADRGWPRASGRGDGDVTASPSRCSEFRVCSKYSEFRVYKRAIEWKRGYSDPEAHAPHESD